MIIVHISYTMLIIYIYIDSSHIKAVGVALLHHVCTNICRVGSRVLKLFLNVALVAVQLI